MKKLLFFLLFCEIFAWGQVVEYNGIKVDSIRSSIYYINKFGVPYLVTITNNSNKTVVIDKDFIDVTPVSQEEIVAALRQGYKVGFMHMGSLSLIFGAMAYVGNQYPSGIFKKYENATHLKQGSGEFLTIIDTETGCKVIPPSHLSQNGVRYFVGPSIALGLIAGHQLYRFINYDQKNFNAHFKDKIFHEPIKLKPGESIQKLVWTKNSFDDTKINFEKVTFLE